MVNSFALLDLWDDIRDLSLCQNSAESSREIGSNSALKFVFCATSDSVDNVA